MPSAKENEEESSIDPKLDFTLRLGNEKSRCWIPLQMWHPLRVLVVLHLRRDLSFPCPLHQYYDWSHLGFMSPGCVDFETLQHSGIFDKKKQVAVISLVVQKQHPILMAQFLCNVASHRGPPIIPGWAFQSICYYCTFCYFRLSFWRGYSISNV